MLEIMSTLYSPFGCVPKGVVPPRPILVCDARFHSLSFNKPVLK